MKTRVIIFVICLLGTLTAAAQTKRALVIGLGRYMDSDWEKINGDKDVPYMHLSSDCPTLSCIPSQVQSMEEGRREPPIGLSCPALQETSGASRGQVACILERKTSSCYGCNYIKVRFSS